jgi:hypothetical protein
MPQPESLADQSNALIYVEISDVQLTAVVPREREWVTL